MAEQTSVYELQCSSAAKSAQERREKQEIASVISLLFSKTQYSTRYKLPWSGWTAGYTSKFAVTSLIEAIDNWLEQKLLLSLSKSPFFLF